MAALTLEDILAAIRWVAREAGGGAPIEAACRTLLARSDAAARHVGRTGRAHPEFGDGSIAAAAHSLGRGQASGPWRGDLLAAGAVVCRMLAERRQALRSSRSERH